MNGSFLFQDEPRFPKKTPHGPRGKEEIMNIWFSILFIAGTVLTITEVTVSMYGNDKQARIAAEKELQHVRFTYGKRRGKGTGNILREIGGHMHEYGGFRRYGEEPYGGITDTAPGSMDIDLMREADRRNMEEMRMANQRDMAFAYMSANEAMRETMEEAQRENSAMTIDSTMFF